MALSPLKITQFQFVGISGVPSASASPLANGTVEIHLTKDCQAPSGTASSPGQVTGRQKSIIQLDSNGEVPDTYTFWPNSELTPNDSAYIISAYSQQGERVLGPISIYVGNNPLSVGFGTAFGQSFGS